MKKMRLIMLLLLLSVGCTRLGNDALFEAIRAKDVKDVERILSKGNVVLEPPQEPNLNNKPLTYAAVFGNLDIVKLILAKGADINGQAGYGDVALIKAVEIGNRDIAVYLLEEGADVNIPNAFGISPFIGFCAVGDIGLVEIALKHGGEINKSYLQRTRPGPGGKNYTALQASVVYGKIEVVKFLLASGGDPKLKNSKGKTCLEIAQEKGHEEIVEMLK